MPSDDDDDEELWQLINEGAKDEVCDRHCGASTATALLTASAILVGLESGLLGLPRLKTAFLGVLIAQLILMWFSIFFAAIMYGGVCSQVWEAMCGSNGCIDNSSRRKLLELRADITRASWQGRKTREAAIAFFSNDSSRVWEKCCVFFAVALAAVGSGLAWGGEKDRALSEFFRALACFLMGAWLSYASAASTDESLSLNAWHWRQERLRDLAIVGVDANREQFLECVRDTIERFKNICDAQDRGLRATLSSIRVHDNQTGQDRPNDYLQAAMEDLGIQMGQNSELRVHISGIALTRPNEENEVIPLRS